MNNIINNTEMVKIQEKLHAFNNEFNILTKNVENILLDGIIDRVRKESLTYSLEKYCDTYEKFIEEIYKTSKATENIEDNMLEINKSFDKMKIAMNSLKLNTDICLSETTLARFKNILENTKK